MQSKAMTLDHSIETCPDSRDEKVICLLSKFLGVYTDIVAYRGSECNQKGSFSLGLLDPRTISCKRSRDKIKTFIGNYDRPTNRPTEK